MSNQQYIQLPESVFTLDKTHFCYRQPNHSNLVRFFFPDCAGGNGSGGVDLPKCSEDGFNIEIKESRITNRYLLILHYKDFEESEYVLYFYWKYFTFYLIKLPKWFKTDMIDDLELLEREKVGFGKKWILEHTVKRWKITKTKLTMKLKMDIQTYINSLRCGIEP